MPPSVSLEATAQGLVKLQKPAGYWATTDARPPQIASRFTSTAYAIEAIKDYLPEQAAEIQRLSLKFGIREVIAEGNEVAVFYDLSTSGVTLFAAGRFQIRDGKVILIHVVFDPRPILETMAKK